MTVMDKVLQESCQVLDKWHTTSCFETGDHPDEIDTPFSRGADAIRRLSAIDKRNQK